MCKTIKQRVKFKADPATVTKGSSKRSRTHSPAERTRLTYSALLHCATCGGMPTDDIKKERY